MTCKIICTWRNRVIDLSQNDVKSDVQKPEKAVCSKVCFVAIFLSVLRIFRKEKQIRKVESILFVNMSISLKSKDGPKTAQTVPCPFKMWCYEGLTRLRQFKWMTQSDILEQYDFYTQVANGLTWFSYFKYRLSISRAWCKLL